MSGLAGRVALAAVALAVLVPLGFWLAAATRYERALERVEESGGSISPERAEDIRSDLRSAAGDTPSTEPEVGMAQLELFLERPRLAARELHAVVRREPDNAGAWGLLAIALRGSDPAAARRAARREDELRAGFARGN